MNPTIEVTGIRIRRALVPVKRVLNTRVGRFTRGPFLLIDLELKGGGTGRTLGFTFMPIGLKVVPILLEELVATLKGRRIGFTDAPAVHDACQKALTHMGHEGVAQMALSMLDMALHDALAREAGVPLYKLLGGSAVALPTYNSCGLGIMEPLEAAREAKELVAEHGGFSHIKLRMGRGDAAGEVAAYKAVRSAVGPDIVISCDFNQGLPSAEALDTCRAIDGLGLAWIEEPVAYDDYWRPSSQRRSRSARTGGAGASARRRSRWVRATM
jgi:mandelate racemase